jgi:hypothetical protein
MDQLHGDEALRFAESHLRKIGVDESGWETRFENPVDGSRWLMDYPQSEMQGGGPPRLIKIG